MARGDLEARVDAVRRFNRFFTRRIGVLREGLLHSRYSLTEARVLFELANREETTATDLSRELGLDPGYLSRTLARLEEQGLVARIRSMPSVSASCTWIRSPREVGRFLPT